MIYALIVPVCLFLIGTPELSNKHHPSRYLDGVVLILSSVYGRIISIRPFTILPMEVVMKRRKEQFVGFMTAENPETVIVRFDNDSDKYSGKRRKEIRRNALSRKRNRGGE